MNCNILIPMAGAGKRFSDAGYKESKPSIPTTDHRTGNKKPMVVCASLDLPLLESDGSNLILVDRDFHRENGTEANIKKYLPKARFITVDHLTEGQACTCLLAKEIINNEDELLIASCDNGMIINLDKFNNLRNECEVIVFTYRNNEAVLANPNAYGWVKVDEHDNVLDVSVKKAISENPMNDHAIVATFWFKHGKDFVRCANTMIESDDRINNEFYVDKVVTYCLKAGLKTKVFEIARYLGWGTPKDYVDYENTISYWKEFVASNSFIPKDRIH